MSTRLEIASTVHGDPDAPTVILIHGVVHQQHAWDAVVPLLATKYRVVTFDLPGHGASGAIPDVQNPIPFVLESLVDIIEDLSKPGERPHLAGNSLGGYVALEMGSRGLASGVTGISPAGFFRNRFELKHAEQVFLAMKKSVGVIKPLVPRLSSNTVGRSVMFGAFSTHPWKYPANSMLLDANALAENTLLDDLPDLDFTFSAPQDRNLPITIAWGTRDLVLFSGQRNNVHTYFPQARIIPMKGLGHVPMSDDPERIAEIIDNSAARSFAREKRLGSLRDSNDGR